MKLINDPKLAILDRIDVQVFFDEYFSGWHAGKNVACPFAAERHSGGADTKPSFSISAEGAAYCHACQYKATTAVGFFVDIAGKPYPEAIRELYSRVVTPLIPESCVQDAAKRLLKEPELLGKLHESRGIEMALVERMELGWDGGRLTIPIRDECGMLVNIRKYDLLKRHESKMISWAQGFGAARLWPLAAFEQETVILCEGEMDALVGMQHGLNMVTTTGGAGPWKPEWSDHFEGKRVVIVPDNDDAGEKALKKRRSALLDVAASIDVLRLTEKEGR